MSLIAALVLLAATVPVVVALMRANELFLLRLEDGRIKRVRGTIPQGLLNDIADVVRGNDSGELRGVSEDNRVRLYLEGDFTEQQRQALANTIARWPVARVRNS
jgi:hypothetical protein